MLEKEFENATIILASGSPRRKELLAQGGIPFTVIKSDCDENSDIEEPAAFVEELSLRKAENVFEKVGDSYGDSYIILAADTIVAYEGEILGKPLDETEALDMLGLLSDRTHQVYTGVTLLQVKEGNKKAVTFSERTDVTFYPMSRIEILNYISTKDPLDKAGSYGIQGPCAIHIKKIKGDYNNVVGLPLSRVYQELKKLLY
ncbi:MAG: septum formation protein Maf [Lachnospiraceae bacterium]|nr:septum formation protein Maf [Lachnospiraceae bacterium]